MSRYVVLKEGFLYKALGHFIHKGAISLPEDKESIPCVYDGNHSNLLGQASFFDYDPGSGEWTCDIDLVDNQDAQALSDHGDITWTYYLTGVESTTEDGVVVVTKATLTGIQAIIPYPGIPDVFRKVE